MPQVLSDIVDVYVFRRLNARVQFLLLQRRRDVALGQTWQSFHTRIAGGESTVDAARRAVQELAGLHVSAVFSADYINQFFDDTRDALVLAPVLAVNVSPQAPVRLDPELHDCAWLDRDEATVRLPFSGQRWAVRHIDEIMSIGHAEADLYRLSLPTSEREQRPPAEATGDTTIGPPPTAGWSTETVTSEHVRTPEPNVPTEPSPNGQPADSDDQAVSPTIRTDVRSETE